MQKHPKKKIKILYVITKSVWGGAQRYVYDLAVNLPKKEFDVVVAAGGDGPLFDLLQKKGIHTIAIDALARDVHILNEFRVFQNLLKIYKKELPDIIHLNSSKIGVVGAIAGKLFNFRRTPKTKIIFTAHGWVFKEERPKIIQKILRLMVRLSTLFTNHIIIISRSDLRDAKQFISPKKIIFIPNGIDAARKQIFSKKYARTIITKQLVTAIPSHAKLVGIVAEHTKNKGLLYAIEGFQRLVEKNPRENPHLIFIGDGEEQDKLRRYATERGLALQIHFAGFLKDVHKLLPALDIFLLPSLKEGLPYSILEAMASSLPIVATNVGGIPDLIRHEKEGLLVPPKNPEAIALALEKLLITSSLKENLGAQAKKRSQKFFTLDRMLSETAQLYRTTLQP